MTIFGLIVLLIICFYFLAQVCDKYFVESLDRISKHWSIPSDVAGATLMAMGSSAPELFIAIIALVKTQMTGENIEVIGMGTIVGSALFNILVIIGSVAIVRTAILRWQPVVRDMIFYSISIVLLLLFFSDGHITITESAILVACYVIYVIATFYWRKILPYEDTEIFESAEELHDAKEEEASRAEKFTKPLDFILDRFFPSPEHYYRVFFVSILVIMGLSWLLVEAAVEIAETLHVPKSIIALTILAAGTSIPDMLSSIIVARQGRGGMAISNAVGSNVFDILVGLGLPWMFYLIFTENTVTVERESLNTSILLLFATVLVIFVLLLVRKWKLKRISGYMLIALYVGYVCWAIYDSQQQSNTVGNDRPAVEANAPADVHEGLLHRNTTP